MDNKINRIFLDKIITESAMSRDILRKINDNTNIIRSCLDDTYIKRNRINELNAALKNINNTLNDLKRNIEVVNDNSLFNYSVTDISDINDEEVNEDDDSLREKIRIRLKELDNNNFDNQHLGLAPKRNIDLFDSSSVNNSDRYATGTRIKRTHVNKRSGFKSLTKRMRVRSKLKFIKFFQEKKKSPPIHTEIENILTLKTPPKEHHAYFRIRIWKDENDTTYYDCACDGRKPVQDVSKIKLHAIAHDKQVYTCNLCGKTFLSNHLQLNAHKKIHKIKSNPF